MTGTVIGVVWAVVCVVLAWNFVKDWYDWRDRQDRR